MLRAQKTKCGALGGGETEGVESVISEYQNRAHELRMNIKESEGVEDLPQNLYVVMLNRHDGKTPSPLSVHSTNEVANNELEKWKLVLSPTFTVFVLPYHHFSSCGKGVEVPQINESVTAGNSGGVYRDYQSSKRGIQPRCPRFSQ